jgi:hypothetical protein
MRVPRVLRRLAAEPGADRHQLDARLDQAPAEQARLTQCIPAIAVAQSRRLPVQVERLPDGRVRQQSDGTFLVDVERARRGRLLQGPRLLIHESEQSLPVVEPGGRHVGPKREVGDVEVRTTGIMQDRHGVVLPAQEAGELAGRQVADVGRELRQLDEPRHGRLPGRHPGDDRAEVGVIAGRGGEVNGVAAGWVAGQRLVRGRLVMRAGLGAGAGDGEEPRALGEQRDVFTEPDPRRMRLGDAEFAADAVRRVGLGVEGFILAGRAPQEDEDTGVGGRYRACPCRCVLQAKEVRQRQTHAAQRAGAKQITARQTVTQAYRGSGQAGHGYPRPRMGARLRWR